MISENYIKCGFSQKREFDPRVKALMLYKFLKTHRTDEDLEKLKVF